MGHCILNHMGSEPQNHFGWKRPLRSLSPSFSPRNTTRPKRKEAHQKCGAAAPREQHSMPFKCPHKQHTWSKHPLSKGIHLAAWICFSFSSSPTTQLVPTGTPRLPNPKLCPSSCCSPAAGLSLTHTEVPTSPAWPWLGCFPQHREFCSIHSLINVCVKNSIPKQQ